MLTYSRYRSTRFWAVYDGDELLCVTVYLKGALAVIERITGVKPERPRRKKAKTSPPSRPKLPKSRDVMFSHILEAAVNAQGGVSDRLEMLEHIEALAREGLRVSVSER